MNTMHFPAGICLLNLSRHPDGVMMLDCSREHQELVSLTTLSAMSLPFTDKSVSDLLKCLPDAFHI